MFRPSILLSIIALATAAGPIRAQNLLSKPETIVWDSAHSRYLVSNWNTGDIVQIDLDGSYTLFSPGVFSAAGLHIIGDSLFVASNFSGPQGITIFSLTTAQQIGYFQPPGMQFANSICSDSSGHLYISDTQTHRIYKVSLATGASLVLCNTIIWPNGVFFDRRRNRLLVASNVSESPLWAVNTTTGGVSAATTFVGEFDGMDEDNLHNLYVSWSGAGQVYRFDSTLSGTPALIRSGHNQPEGICFNRQHSVLGIPNMFAHTVDLIPYDVDVWADIDSVTGWAPVSFTFKGRSVLGPTTYVWDFGDGQTAVGDSVDHTFSTPGSFDVTVEGVTAVGDSIPRVYPRHLVALGDSVWADSIETDIHTNKVEVVVGARFSTALRELFIPVTYSGSLNLLLDSVSTRGCLTSFFNKVYKVHSDSSAKQSTFRLIARETGSPLYISANRGPILKLYFRYVSPVDSQSASIQLGEYLPEFPSQFVGRSITYSPRDRNGAVTIPPCCHTLTGNVDCDPADGVDISDLSALIDNLYINLTPLCCPREANTDGQSGTDISDLTALIDYLYISFTPPAACQ